MDLPNSESNFNNAQEELSKKDKKIENLEVDIKTLSRSRKEKFPNLIFKIFI